MKNNTFKRSALALAVTAALPMVANAAEEPRELPFTEAAAAEEQGYKVDKASSPKLTQSVADTPKTIGYTDLMVDGAPLPHQPDTIIRWLIDRLRS